MLGEPTGCDERRLRACPSGAPLRARHPTRDETGGRSGPRLSSSMFQCRTRQQRCSPIRRVRMHGARTYTVEFIGFSATEKAPFIGNLMLSQCRSICYEEKKGAGADTAADRCRPCDDHRPRRHGCDCAGGQAQAGNRPDRPGNAGARRTGRGRRRIGLGEQAVYGPGTAGHRGAAAGRRRDLFRHRDDRADGDRLKRIHPGRNRQGDSDRCAQP